MIIWPLNFSVYLLDSNHYPSLRLLEGILRENPTFQNQSLLKLVVRFRCYVSYTFNIPTNLDYINEGAVQDPILSAWLALIENTTDILTCEYVSKLCL